MPDDWPQAERNRESILQFFTFSIQNICIRMNNLLLLIGKAGKRQ